MNEDAFHKLIDPSKFQVFFFASRMSIPFSFALHTWVVIVDRGEVYRYDVWGFAKRCETSKGHVHINLYKPWVGVRKFPARSSNPLDLRFQGFLLHQLEGDKDSLAQEIVTFMQNNSYSYPYIDIYGYFPGPNSNTFTQWVINQFPKLNFRLPWTAIGKNYLK